MEINKIKILLVNDGGDDLNKIMIEIHGYKFKNVRYVYYAYWDLDNANKPITEFQYNVVQEF